MKLILTDIDGTLMGSSRHVSRRNLDAIKKIKEQGYMFGVASGRNDTDLKRNFPAELFDDLDVVVGENGYRVKDFTDDSVILGTLLKQERVKETMDFFKGIDYSLIYIDEHGVGCASQHQILDEVNKQFNALPNYKLLTDEEFVKVPTSKLTLFVRTKDVPEVLERLKNWPYKDVIWMQTLYNCLEFQDQTTTKANGIKKFIEKHQIRREDVIVFGDGENDVEMVDYAGCGIAMKNACDKVKAVADIVLDYTNNEDGVARYLETLS
jgi:Cof subfamily protein (haloacid dehalogenase superfamily)